LTNKRIHYCVAVCQTSAMCQTPPKKQTDKLFVSQVEFDTFAALRGQNSHFMFHPVIVPSPSIYSFYVAITLFLQVCGYITLTLT